jgi:hypothetical protein
MSLQQVRPDQDWAYPAAASGIVNTTTAVTIKAAGAANGAINYINGIQLSTEALTTATELVVRDGAGGTVLWRVKIGTAGIPFQHFTLPTPLRGSPNTLLEVCTLTASGAGAVYFNAQGYTR